jgi:hypothetical protein
MSTVLHVSSTMLTIILCSRAHKAKDNTQPRDEADLASPSMLTDSQSLEPATRRASNATGDLRIQFFDPNPHQRRGSAVEENTSTDQSVEESNVKSPNPPWAHKPQNESTVEGITRGETPKHLHHHYSCLTIWRSPKSNLDRLHKHRLITTIFSRRRH